MSFYDKELGEVFRELGTSESGLTDKEAQERLARYGPNEIKKTKGISPIKIFLEQFKSVIVWVLIAATIVSIMVGEYLDTFVILIIIIVDAVLGFLQQYRAEKTIEALKKLASLSAIVIRDKAETELPTAKLVPGDIIILNTGQKVPADARLIQETNLEIQESMLTGESMPVRKIMGIVKKTLISEQSNMVFSGTIITKGRGKAVVVATGMQTELGKIAEQVQEAEDGETPLQANLDKLGKFLAVAVLIISVIIFGAGIIQGKEPLVMFMAAISLAVAAIPEGLPAIVTISLALGIQRMAKKKVLIRKLPSVETLGCTTVICSDKTGTLTCDEMTVKKIYTIGRIVDVEGEGYSFEGKFSKKLGKSEKMLLKIGVLCNDAEVNSEVIGSPTEAALIVSAAKAGIIKKELDAAEKRVAEEPFDSNRKLMTTVNKSSEGSFAYTKGAPAIVLAKCSRIYADGKIRKLTEKDKKEILKTNELFAKQAYRVLGFAYKPADKLVEKELIFAGLQAMIDPLRKEAKDAVEKCKKAGIRVLMITGDQELTAVAIAKQLGLEGDSITGEELDKITNLSELVEKITIYARVSPEHKTKIVDALKEKGHVVAMTGDGVNDAPALKKADIGIAMGKTGTDVAKEASEMILTDDDFASIVNAIEEGRSVYDDIKKFVKYLLSSNLGELLTVFIAILLGMPLPLVAIQILWMNLVTDGLPALALGLEKTDPEVMSKMPRSKKEGIITKNMLINMLLVGGLMSVGTLLLFSNYLPKHNLQYAQTVAFTTLVMFQLFNVLNCRSEDKSLFKLGFFSNKLLIGAIATSLVLQLLVVYYFNAFFDTVPLNPVDWLVIVGVASSVLIAVEILKFIRRRMEPAKAQ